VGINPDSLEWTQLYHKLRGKSEYCVAGDFSSFDGTMHPEIMSAICDLINEWYDDGEENAVIRRTLMEEMIHTMHICMNSVYGSVKGDPSGNNITVVLTTIGNIMYMRMAYLLLAWERNEGLSLVDYHNNVEEVAYGDDNILAITPSTLTWFNQKTMSIALKLYGVTYTDPEKKGITECARLDDVTFLKRGFRQDQYIPIIRWAPIDVKVLRELTNWIRTSDDDEEATLVNCTTSVRFAFHHGKEFYDQHLASINEQLWKVGLRGIPNEYLLLHHQYSTS